MTSKDDIFDQKFDNNNFGEENEQASQNLTWLLRAKTNSKHYADFMSVNLTSKNTAVLIVKNKRYPFDFKSISDMLAQVVDILGSDELPKEEE